MNIDERKNLIKKIIADLELLISHCWNVDTKEKLKDALDILVINDDLEGYDD